MNTAAAQTTPNRAEQRGHMPAPRVDADGLVTIRIPPHVLAHTNWVLAAHEQALIRRSLTAAGMNQELVQAERRLNATARAALGGAT